MCKYHVAGKLLVKDGTYEKDGKEHNRYREVGVMLSSPHGSHKFIKLHATPYSDARILSIQETEPAAPSTPNQDTKTTLNEMEF